MNAVAPPAKALPVKSDLSSAPTAPGPASTAPVSPRADSVAVPTRGGWFWPLTLVVLAAVVAGGWIYRERLLPLVGYHAPPKDAKKPSARIIPVVTAPAKQREMNLYLNGLGTVTALKTVTIRSRVEGEIIRVNFTEGQMVKEGDLLAEIDTRPFEVQRDQAKGQLARDEATLKSAKINLERLEKAAKSNAVSPQEVQNQIALVEQTEGILKSDQAMVANAELQLTYCKITAPIDGRIGLRLVDVGNIVRANDPSGIAVVNQLQPIAIVFTISQDDIPRVQERFREQKELTVEAYDRDFTHKLATGKLIATDNQVDATTGTLRLKAQVDQDAGSLFPNQFVNTRLLVDTRKDAIVIPSAAVQRGPSATFVYLVKGETGEESVELRNVQVGPSEGAETIIESGLEPGEVVVTDGIDKLQPGAKISIRDPNAKAADGGKPGGAKGRLPEHGPEGQGAERNK